MQINMLIFNIHLTSLFHINVNKQLIDFTKHFLTPVIHFKTPLPLSSYSPQKILQGLRLPDNGNETIKAGNGNPMNLKSRDTEVVHICFCFWISQFFSNKIHFNFMCEFYNFGPFEINHEQFSYCKCLSQVKSTLYWC